ncbi:MAG: hypothetical protein ACREBS_04655 [Nitrososphaerales archaeon]
MASKKLVTAVLLAAALLVSVVPMNLQQPSFTHYVSAQGYASAPSDIELGFSPTTLSSPEEGAPIYAPGDSMWFLTNSSQIVSVGLTSPAGATVASKSVSPYSVILIYTFAKTEPEGNWQLKLLYYNSTIISLSITLVSYFAHRVGLSLSRYSIQSGELNLNFSVAPSDAYDLVGCMTSNDTNSTVELPLPSGIGEGTISVLNNLQSSFISLKQVPPSFAPFSFWYTLDYSYSYTGNVTGEALSRNLVAISSSSVVVSTGSSHVLALTNETSPRPGEYTMRAFFDSSNGLSVAQTNVLLLTNGQWLWLGGCKPFEVTSTFFTQQVSLTQAPSAWPSSIYLTYRVNGVSGYSVSNLQISPVRIELLGEPGNVSLPYLSYSIVNSHNVQASGEFGGSIFLVGSSFPLSLSIVPSFGNKQLSAENVTIPHGFTATLVGIPVGTLVVHVVNNSFPATGAQIGVVNGAGGRVTQATSSNGSAVFYLPTGAYDVSLVSGGVVYQKNASVSAGSETVFGFAFTNSRSVNYLPALLGSLLVVGIVLNIWAWLIRPRRFRHSIGSKL